jgi:ATP-binding cassette subfamily B (MDR/TAP) protein 1
VVGPSGSGKSTIGNLLLKYYKPLSGDIFVDCYSIQTLDTGWVRRNITLVQQDSVLFNETIRQNICFGNRDMCGIYDIHKACETASLREAITEMPDGLDTIVGFGGRSLSGGQQQRVAIARARLRDASILILDESTSALDHSSKLQVMAKIREWRKGKTTIIITHDMSQILDDDYVYVLDHANLVQEGYHKNLDRMIQATSAPPICVNYDTEKIQQANTYEPSGMTESCEEVSSPHWCTIPKLFGISNPSSSRPSFTQPSAFRSGFSLSTPMAASSPLPGNSRTPSPVSLPRRISDSQIPSPAVEKSTTPTLHCKGLGFIYGSPEGLSDSRNRIPAANLSSSSRPMLVLRTLGLPAKQAIPGDNFDHNQKTTLVSLTKIFGTIWPTLTRNCRIIYVLGFFAAFIVAACTPAFGYVFARLLGVFYLPQDERGGQALKFALSLLGIAILDGLACFSTRYMLEYCAQFWVTSLRLEAFRRILAQPRSWFDDDKNNPGQLSEALDRNAEEMRNLVGRFAGPVCTVIWMLGISIVASFIISWKITLIALACGPVVYIMTRTFHTISSKWEDKCNKSAELTNRIFTETFANIRVVRALTLEDHFAQRHRTAIMETYKTGFSRALYCGSVFGISDAVNFFITGLIFYYGTVLITSGSHSVDSIIQVVNLLLFGIANASSMLSMVPQIGFARATATSMLRLANLPLDASHETQGSRRLITPLPIQLTDLSFTYPKQAHVKILSHISLHIAAGTCTAIVGPSGSGKTTILSILQCLYPPDPPQLLISSPPLRFAGVSVENCNISALRAQISVVPQTPVLFPSSILDNIIYGLPETSPFRNFSAAQRAAEQAGIHSFITSLDSGYETLIGDGGMGISGGQAQRIAIARALVRRPKVLILDEPTSALDAESAEGVRSVVRTLVREGMAVVVVSHAVEMMKLADWVVVIEEGKMAEEGKFEDLCGKGGALARLIGIEGGGRRR